jgi:hypothetical protein
MEKHYYNDDQLVLHGTRVFSTWDMTLRRRGNSVTGLSRHILNRRKENIIGTGTATFLFLRRNVWVKLAVCLRQMRFNHITCATDMIGAC